MPDLDDLLAEARASYSRRDWTVAYRSLAAVREQQSLTADDLHAMADAAWWLGLVKETMTISEECHQHFLAEGRPLRAAMNALGIGFDWFLRGEVAIGSGWLSRARRLIEQHPDSAESGFLVWIDTAAALEAGKLDSALVGALQVQEIGRRFGSPTLVCLGLASEGIVTIRRGRVAAGFALLDEAMLPVLAGQLEPEWAGNIYCELMGVCHDLADIDRARQWTAATERWCEGFPSAVMFVGICRMHRIQLLRIGGDWARAQAEASIACEELADLNVAVVGEAHCQLAELRRLRGDLVGAEQAYRRARELGRDPQPGAALLLLAQGRPGDAAAAVRTALADRAHDPFRRARLLAAYVEIALAGDDLGSAVDASQQLRNIADTFASAGFLAWADHVRGAVLLAQGKPGAALQVLRAALRAYSEMGAPYDAATVRILIGEAHQLLGDADAATLEYDAATATYVKLGAQLPVGRLVEPPRAVDLPGGLTDREAEVLAQIAGGASNKQAAAALFISEKTVARHLANIFAKLGLGSRTAAASWAYEHQLRRPRQGA
ncbi:MAG TPA: LuxR C-terminal-related transcriptional regulator [Microlunatus sp.]